MTGNESIRKLLNAISDGMQIEKARCKDGLPSTMGFFYMIESLLPLTNMMADLIDRIDNYDEDEDSPELDRINNIKD